MATQNRRAQALSRAVEAGGGPSLAADHEGHSELWRSLNARIEPLRQEFDMRVALDAFFGADPKAVAAQFEALRKALRTVNEILGPMIAVSPDDVTDSGKLNMICRDRLLGAMGNNPDANIEAFAWHAQQWEGAADAARQRLRDRPEREEENRTAHEWLLRDALPAIYVQVFGRAFEIDAPSGRGNPHPGRAFMVELLGPDLLAVTGKQGKPYTAENIRKFLARHT